MSEDEHRIFMRWRVEWHKRPDANGRRVCKNLEAGKRDAHRLRNAGNTLTACSYCEFVPSWDDCPVCHNRGTLSERMPPQANPLPQAHWQPSKRKQRG